MARLLHQPGQLEVKDLDLEVKASLNDTEAECADQRKGAAGSGDRNELGEDIRG